MRIIAGEFGGRRLRAPPGKGTRPMLDRVREALFSTLGSELVGARVLDLFAGTGSLGLEALSRGAASARLIERDRKAVGILRENVEALGLSDRARIVARDALDPSGWGTEGNGPLEPYEIVFLDPPYSCLEEPASRRRVITTLVRLVEERLAPGGVLVFHAPRGRIQTVELGPRVACRVREYGTNALWYVRRREEAPA